MSALICQRPSSIDRRDKRLGNGHARARRHRIKRAVGPIRPRAFRVQANYLDALNASRLRIHRQKPKALGLKFGCGFTRGISSSQGSFQFIPRVIRDAIYDLVARNRYRWFGRRDACILPNSDRLWPS